MPPGTDIRRLAAIMFTDIAGYTAMVQKDEDEALRKVASHRRHLTDFTAKYQGQVIQFYGDGSLSIYDSVVDAVRCAIAMQRAYQEEDKVPVRIGIHLGDFVIKDGTVFGDGINIASRIQVEGVPGSILISDKVNSELVNHSDIATASLGTYALKNVLDPVSIFAVKATGLVIPRRRSKLRKYARHGISIGVPLAAIGLTLLVARYFVDNRPVGERLQEERIAVPQFEDLTNVPEYGTFSRMAAHWITTELIESVHASVVSYQSAVENTPIAFASNASGFSEHTGAVNVINGAYRLVGRSTDTLEFSATILNLRTGLHLDVKLPRPRCLAADPMVCIHEMASALKGFWQSRSDNVLKPPKFEAYKAYLEARSVWLTDPVKAEQFLRKSIELDPEFIDAYFLLLDWFYNQRQLSDAAAMLQEIQSKFTNLTARQKNYLQYHLADNQGRNVDAFNYFMQEYERDPKDLFVNTSGMVLATEYVNDPKKAIEFFGQINQENLDLAEDSYHQNRVAIAISAYHALGKIRQASKLADILKRYVQGPRNYQKLIEFYVARKDTVSANQLLAEAMMHVDQPYKPYLYLIAGRQAQLRGDESLRDLYARRSASLSPDSSRALARSYYLMDSLDMALRIYQLTSQRDSTDNRIYAEMGVIYARNGQKELAEQMVNIVESLKPAFDYGNTSYFQGRIAANLGERERALRLLEKSFDEGNKFFGSVTFTQDPDLMMLRNDPDYKKLLKRL